MGKGVAMKQRWVSKVKLQNSAGHAISFTLEPWGDEHRIPHGMTAHISGLSDEEGCFHVELTNEGVLVWAWPESETSVRVGTEAPGQASVAALGDASNARARGGVVHLLGRAMVAAGDRLLRLGDGR
jgi:hypothetical protein